MRIDELKKGQKVWVFLPSHKREKMEVCEVESKTCVHVVTEKYESYFVHPRQLAQIRKKRKLAITKITYAQLKNTGDYENRRIEATAEIGHNQNPDLALKELIQWVKKKLNSEEGE